MTDWQRFSNPLHENKKWSRKFMDSLPDAAFLIVDEKRVSHKEAGRSHPLDARHLPVLDRNGRVSCAHVRNAIARAPLVRGVSDTAKDRAQATARSMMERNCRSENPTKERSPTCYDDIRHAIVAMRHGGRVLLGNVEQTYERPGGPCRAVVLHFNGEPWPIEPAVSKLRFV